MKLDVELPRITEVEFQTQVIQLARLRGWHVAHFRPGLTKSGRWRTAVQADGAGFPDLVLVRDRVVFAELKSEDGRLGPEQVVWQDKLEGAGQAFHVWRPSQWAEIVAVLA